MSPSKVSTIDFTTFHNIINGEKRDGKSQHQGIDPTTREKLWNVPIGDQKDVDEAVAAATKAFKLWSKVPLSERQAKVKSFCETVWPQYSKDFTDLLCRETGKPVSASVNEMSLVVDI